MRPWRAKQPVSIPEHQGWGPCALLTARAPAELEQVAASLWYTWQTANLRLKAKRAPERERERIKYSQLSRAPGLRCHQAGFEDREELTQLCMISFQLLEILGNACAELAGCYYSAGWRDLHILKQNSAERVWVQQGIKWESALSPQPLADKVRGRVRPALLRTK